MRRSFTDVESNSTPKDAPCHRFNPSGLFGFSGEDPRRAEGYGALRRRMGSLPARATESPDYQRAAMPSAMRSASAMHVSMGFTAGLPGKIPVSVM